jgi:alkanesulfonate monooxygenase SsuD/methylene tetrahydromethanopterin reductase-like flavin-dependent oxidoreductase (luciferase family)
VHDRHLTFGLYYDFRHAAPDAAGLTDRWRGIVEQIRRAEQLGFGSVWISEHHFLTDDYASSTLTLAAAIAMQTERMQIGTNVLVLPVHHPLRLAEEALTVDALSGGRLRLGVGFGYREAEFAPFGTSMKARRRRFESGVDVLRRAFSGELVDGVPVSPRAVRAGGPELWVGALSAPAIERAARVGDGFLCVLPDQMALYVEARRALGLDDGRVSIGNQWIVADDPERTFARMGEHVLYQVNKYAEYGAFGPPDLVPRLTDPAQLVELGHYRLLDGPAAAAELAAQISGGPVVDCFSWTLFPGEPLESAAERIDYFARTVIPDVRARVSAPEPVLD